jgi:hypothetical protein
MASRGVAASVSLIPLFQNSKLFRYGKKLRFVIIKPCGVQIWMLMMMYLWTHLRVTFNAYISILVAIQVIHRTLTRRLTTA